jgi:hypothetical protein
VGICVTPIPVMDLIPVQNAKETAEGAEPGYLSQFEKEQCESAGLNVYWPLKSRLYAGNLKAA